MTLDEKWRITVSLILREPRHISLSDGLINAAIIGPMQLNCLKQSLIWINDIIDLKTTVSSKENKKAGSLTGNILQICQMTAEKNEHVVKKAHIKIR